MADVGRRPTLHELLLALHAIQSVEADAAALDPEAKSFRVVLTFSREECPNDWIEGQPKPSWMFEQLTEELNAWLTQRNREEQWVSKEEQMGSSIDTLMAHYTEELKRVSNATPQNIVTRMQTRVFTDTILRLKELKERREAGGVYSQTESKREKARKQWAEDEYEGPKREEEQRRAHAKMNRENIFNWANDENVRRQAEDIFREFTREYSSFYRTDWGTKQPPPQATSGSRWYEILGVPAGASKSDIKKAYRRLAAMHHPDKHVDSRMKKLAEQKMTEINTARDEGLGGL
jgi:DnaJ-domain-containing protein 1